MFEIKDVDLAGRIGRLHTRHGVIETPAFFPVIDPVRQELPVAEVRSAGLSQVLTNAYLLYKRTGGAPVKVHDFLGWDGVVMTDSGAYQILEYGDINVTQDEILEYQKAIETDIGVILDVPTGNVPRERAAETVEETLRRARAALNTIDPESDETVWILPIQGGKYLDLVERSAREAVKLPYRMYGIGSPTVFLEEYRYDVIVEIIYTAKRILPGGRPVHLFGAGHPLIIPFAVALGVDTFDSASYIIYARDGRYMTEYGVYRLEQLDYFPCNCPVCSRYTPRELAEMPKRERTRLLALHNLHVIQKTVRRVKQAIREGRLWELLEETARRHPAARAALAKFRKYYRYLEAGTPTAKGEVRGVRAYGGESLWNPRLLRFQERVLARYQPALDGARRAVLEPLAKDSPCTPPGEGEYRAYYDYFIGVVPWELCGVYPSIHVDHGGPTLEAARHLENALIAFIHKLLKLGVEEVVVKGPAAALLARRRPPKTRLEY
ncbi:tRNA guanosine(15) transglycosylase TgtA [Stetteria hydrogenophila]